MNDPHRLDYETLPPKSPLAWLKRGAFASGVFIAGGVEFACLVVTDHLMKNARSFAPLLLMIVVPIALIVICLQVKDRRSFPKGVLLGVFLWPVVFVIFAQWC